MWSLMFPEVAIESNTQNRPVYPAKATTATPELHAALLAKLA